MDSTPSTKRIKQRATEFGVASCALVVAVLLAEGGLRTFSPQPRSWLEIYVNHPRHGLHALAPHVDSVVDTGETNYRVHTDARGYRSGARTSTEAAVLLLGDSFTFGQGVSFGASFAGQLESKGWSAANTAVPGYGLEHAEIVLDDYLRHEMQPTAVVLTTYVGNDFWDCASEPRRLVTRGVLDNPGGPKAWLKRHTHLYRLSSKAFHLLSSRPASNAFPHGRIHEDATWRQPRLREGVRRCGAAMKRIRKRTDGLGLPLLVVVLPTRNAVLGHGGQAGEAFRRPVEEMLGLVERLQIDGIDMTNALIEVGETAFLIHDSHLTAAGHVAVGAAIGRWLHSVDVRPPRAPGRDEKSAF